MLAKSAVSSCPNYYVKDIVPTVTNYKWGRIFALHLGNEIYYVGRLLLILIAPVAKASCLGKIYFPIIFTSIVGMDKMES